MSSSTSPENADSSLTDSLRQTLLDLHHNPYPHIENPDTCKKRASVALIIRVRPHFEHSPPKNSHTSEDNTSPEQRLDAFFNQEWVQKGDAEVVFIKRAARQGDRWTSHVALPGGKRDPEDEDDKAVAIRETSEEIGLDLTSSDALFVGNLPQRVVSTSWGKVPIMVLCPFVFLWTQPDLPPLKLQPGEVASTHWVPLRTLLSPSLRTYEYVDVSDRFARQGGPIVKSIIRSVLGKMRFSAIRLLPSESLHCTSTAEFFSPDDTLRVEVQRSLTNRIYNWYLGDHAGSSDRTRPLLLWGLTLGMLADFLDQLPPHNAVKLWSYPTFTSLDVRTIINILTAPLKRRNQARLELLGVQNTAMDSETQAVTSGLDNPWFIGGMTAGVEPSVKGKNAGKAYAVGVMLEGYYDLARRGVWIAACMRMLGGLVFVMWIVRRYWARQRRRF